MTSPDCSSHAPLPLHHPCIESTTTARKGGNRGRIRADEELRRAVLAALSRLRNAFTAGRRAGIAVFALAVAVTAPPAAAITPFVVKDVRVEGVQRTEAGTVFSYLPIKVGD